MTDFEENDSPDQLLKDRRKLEALYHSGKVIKKNKLSYGTRFAIAAITILITSVATHYLISTYIQQQEAVKYQEVDRETNKF